MSIAISAASSMKIPFTVVAPMGTTVVNGHPRQPGTQEGPTDTQHPLLRFKGSSQHRLASDGE